MYKKLNDDYSRLEVDYNRHLELIKPPVEGGGDNENIFVVDPPKFEGPTKVAHELSDIGDELAKARVQTKKVEKDLEKTNKKNRGTD